MNDRSRDPDLREVFAQLRAEESAGAPGFEETVRVARERLESEPDTPVIPLRTRAEAGGVGAGSWIRRHPRWTLGGGALAAAAAAVLLLAPGMRAEARFERVVRGFADHPAAGSWRSPTDALLRVPGQEIVTTMPKIGVPGLALPSTGRRTRSQL